MSRILPDISRLTPGPCLSRKPRPDGEFNNGEVALGELLVSGRDSPAPFEPTDAAFHDVSTSVFALAEPATTPRAKMQFLKDTNLLLQELDLASGQP